MESAISQIDNTYRKNFQFLDPPPRLLCGPGPSNTHPRVAQALSTPQVGHLDPFFLQTMDEVSDLLRYSWQTSNKFTVAVSGTGSAAMEAVFANLVEPGDKVLICCNGYFGERMVDMAGRYGADIARIERPWGTVFTLEEITAAFEQHKPVLFGIVHGETSTGTQQPMEGLAELCRAHNCLLVADSVTSLGGCPLLVDKWGIDVIYSGCQKTLNCPPGISMLSMSERALQKLGGRKGKVPNWYLDMTMIQKYIMGVGETRTRVYHHTAPISMNYALRESLRVLVDEGLESRWKRHLEAARQLWQGLAEMGIECLVEEPHRLPQLTTCRIPAGVDGKAVAAHMLNHYNIEIGNGLGQLAGVCWRIGLMGVNARPDVVVTVLAALRETLKAQGYQFPQH